MTPGATAPGSWDLVETDAVAHPAADVARGLRMRAQLGRVAAGGPYDSAVAEIFSGGLEEPPAHVDSAAMAAMEALLERVVPDASRGAPPSSGVGRWAAAWDRRAEAGDTGARAFL